jgi:hypothetical protein
MRTWVRAVETRLCGRCGAVIARGEAFLELQLPGVLTKKRRCAGCAEQPVPTLPPLVERTVTWTPPKVAPMTKLRLVIPAALDEWEKGQ